MIHNINTKQKFSTIYFIYANVVQVSDTYYFSIFHILEHFKPVSTLRILQNAVESIADILTLRAFSYIRKLITNNTLSKSSNIQGVSKSKTNISIEWSNTKITLKYITVKRSWFRIQCKYGTACAITFCTKKMCWRWISAYDPIIY